MDVIGADLHRVDHRVILDRDISEDLFHPLLHIVAQDVPAVFRCPYHMVLGVIDGMRRSSDNHVAIVPSRCALISHH